MASETEKPTDPPPNGEADPTARGQAAAQWQRLRHAIDSGRTGEKTAYPDIATSPLGTDDEAGGAVVPPYLEEPDRDAPARGPGRTRASGQQRATAAQPDAAWDPRMDRNMHRQPGPADVLSGRKKRDRVMLAIGAAIGLAFFALLVAV